MFVDDFSETLKLIEASKNMLSSLNQDDELKIIFREHDLEGYKTQTNKTWQDCLSITLYYSMMFATKTIFLTKGEEHWYNNKTESKSLYTRRELVDVLKDEKFNKTTMEYVEKDIIVIPEKITSYFEEWIDDDDWITADPNVIYDFNEQSIDNLTLPIAFDSQKSLNEIVSMRSNIPSNDIRIDMSLPSIRNIPLSDMVKIKKDHKEAFNRYQSALKRLYHNKLDALSDESIRLLFEEIQHEVHNIESELVKIKRSNYGAIVEATLGVTTVGICLFMPGEIASVVGLIAGGSSLKDLIKSVIKYSINKRNIIRSDFYFPWLINDKLKQ